MSTRESALESCFAMPMFHKPYQAFWCDLGFRLITRIVERQPGCSSPTNHLHTKIYNCRVDVHC
jgi:hypothetical protein